MANDPAAFRPEDIVAVHGERPHCIVTNLWQWLDPHHILGRGYTHGFGTRKHGREMFISIFNCAPLHRDVHKGPRINRPSFQAFLLDVTRELVMNAVMAGSYTIRREDEEFLAFVDSLTAEGGTR